MVRQRVDEPIHRAVWHVFVDVAAPAEHRGFPRRTKLLEEMIDQRRLAQARGTEHDGASACSLLDLREGLVKQRELGASPDEP